MKTRTLLIILLVALIALPCFARRRNREVRCMARMQSGMEAFERGRWSRAVNNLSIVRDQCLGEFDRPDSVYFFLGLAYFHGNKPEQARLEFRTIIEDFPHSEFIERTYFYIALSSFNAAPIIQRDPRLLRRAQREFSAFVAAYPTGEFTDTARILLDTISNKLIERELMIAEFYEIIRRFESAVIYYQMILQEFPNSNRIPEINKRLARNLVAANRFAEALVIIEALESAELFKSETETLRRRINQRAIDDERDAGRRRNRGG
ncbi:MAG: outer membrane protein assembly factor BamD [Chitinivibrionia bacterium]|nr:outer membrane protein assembly factor BamD [Chitinivibrionia bacterium]